MRLLLLLPLLLAMSEGAYDYYDALAKSILFYDAQRSGALPDNNPIPWRGDSALDDCVPGGWYDAGDHVKFGLPLGSSVTLLGWGLLQWKDGYQAAGQLDMMYDCIKWAYDWILAAWDPAAQTVVVQIGDADADHAYWGRPEDMTMNRPCFKADASHPGASIAGGYVSALTTGYMTFKEKGDTSYANKLLDAAKSLYTFAKNHRGVWTGTASYETSSDDDEMCEAAAWLYKATQDSQYLDDAKSFVNPWWVGDLGWENKNGACVAILYEATKDATYKSTLEGHLTEGWFYGAQYCDYTPCGLAWKGKWGSLRSTGNGIFFALMLADMGILADTGRKWAVEQMNYILGDNPHDGGCFSYEIGFGSKFPRAPHHRAASCPDMPAPCSWVDDGPSPQVLTGGLVGGPDVSDNYVDDRADYVMNEVALDYNAGFQGGLAAISSLKSKNQLPSTNNKCPCNN